MTLSNIALVTVIQAENYMRKDHADDLQIHAEYIGEGDDVEDEFTLDNIPLEGSLRLYVNNVLKVEGTDFTISGATVTFEVPPTNGHPLTASYSYAASADTFESYDEELIEFLINTATNKVEEYTERAFIEREVTEEHLGDGTELLRLRRIPVSSVSSISVNGEDINSWTERLAVGRVYYYHTFGIASEIEVIYTAGYGATRTLAQAAVPEAVMAVLAAVAHWYDNRMGLKSENVTGVGSVVYSEPSELPEMSKNYLSSLRRRVL